MAALYIVSACFSMDLAQDADAKLNAFFKQYLDETFKLRPLDATRLGDHRFDNLLDDISPQARTTWIEHARKLWKNCPSWWTTKNCRGTERSTLKFSSLISNRTFGTRKTCGPLNWIRASTMLISTRAYTCHSPSPPCPRKPTYPTASPAWTHPRVVAEAERSLQNPPAVVTETAIQQNLARSVFTSGIFFSWPAKRPNSTP